MCIIIITSEINGSASFIELFGYTLTGYMSNISDSSAVKGKAAKVQSVLNEIVISETAAKCSIGFGVITSEDKEYYTALSREAASLKAAGVSSEACRGELD